MFPGLMAKKKATTVILGMGKKPDQEVEHEGEHDALKVIARDMIDAVHAKDEDRMAAALKAAWAECEANEEREE